MIAGLRSLINSWGVFFLSTPTLSMTSGIFEGKFDFERDDGSGRKETTGDTGNKRGTERQPCLMKGWIKDLQ